MKLQITIHPAVEPVSLVEAKLHLRLAVDAAGAAAYTTEDDWLARNIMAARIQAEQETGRAFITQTRAFYLDAWPDRNYIELPYPPLQSAIVTYRLQDDVGYDNPLYTVDVDKVSEPGRIIKQPNTSWPSGTLYTDKPIKITYICGYGLAADVPASIKAAILLKLSDLYENRGEVVVGLSVSRISDAVNSLLRSYQIHTRFD
jgi:uncharacterized phiE125 gp8 family phage protein